MLRSSFGVGKGRLPALRQPLSGRWSNSRSSVLSWNQFRRNASTVTSLESYPNVGESLEGFTVQEKKHVPELHLTAIRLKHDKTDADYLHVAREDKNNVFGVGFKTNPPDATGVPHILEHTTLCGSEKYDLHPSTSSISAQCQGSPIFIFIDTRSAILSLRCFLDRFRTS